MQDEKEILSKFGAKLKELRVKKKMSQEELGFITNLDRTYVSGIERGKRNISLINIEKLAKGLNIRIKDFFDDSKVFDSH